MHMHKVCVHYPNCFHEKILMYWSIFNACVLFAALQQDHICSSPIPFRAFFIHGILNFNNPSYHCHCIGTDLCLIFKKKFLVEYPHIFLFCLWFQFPTILSTSLRWKTETFAWDWNWFWIQCEKHSSDANFIEIVLWISVLEYVEGSSCSN